MTYRIELNVQRHVYVCLFANICAYFAWYTIMFSLFRPWRVLRSVVHWMVRGIRVVHTAQTMLEEKARLMHVVHYQCFWNETLKKYYCKYTWYVFKQRLLLKVWHLKALLQEIYNNERRENRVRERVGKREGEWVVASKRKIVLSRKLILNVLFMGITDNFYVKNFSLIIDIKINLILWMKTVFGWSIVNGKVHIVWLNFMIIVNLSGFYYKLDI